MPYTVKKKHEVDDTVLFYSNLDTYFDTILFIFKLWDFHIEIRKKVAGKYVNVWSQAVVDLALLVYISSSISS